MGPARELRLLAELGSGSFGAVYHALLTEGEGPPRPVALKVLHPDWGEGSDAARRLRDEARILARIRHPAVVRVEDVVRVGGREAVVMEYVEGEDLAALLLACRRAHEPFPVRAALEVVQRVAEALVAVWEHPGEDGPLRVLHRDVKPSNVRLTPAGRVVVLDFGIARAELAGREAVTRSVRYGSRQYLAPERLLRAPDRPAGDAYGLGCVLVELLVGEPFGEARREQGEHERRADAAMAAVADRVGVAGEEIVALARGLLAWDPAARPTAAAVAARCAAVARCVDGEDLAGFAARFLPTVGDHVASTVIPVDRRVEPDSLDGAAPRRADPTVDLPPLTSAPAGRGWVRWAALGALVVVAAAVALALR